jgi:hypothetical protein
MTSRRIEAGPLLVLAGAVLLLVSLFLAWYEPSLEAWDVFEVWDLVLAAIGLTALLAALGMLADFPSAPEARILPWLSGVGLIVVVYALLDRPPIVDQADPDVGLWLALAGTALMAAGTLLGFARVSIAFDVEGRDRRRRVAAVDARGTGAPAAGATPAPVVTPTPATTSAETPAATATPSTKAARATEASPATGTAETATSGGAGASPGLFTGDDQADETAATQPIRPTTRGKRTK